MRTLPHGGVRVAAILLMLGLQSVWMQSRDVSAQQTSYGNTTGGIMVGSGNTVTIGSPATGTTAMTPGVVMGNVTICGPVTAFTPGTTMTQSGVVINLMGATMMGMSIIIGGNFCSQIQVNMNTNQVMRVFVTVNRTGAAFVCTRRCFLLSPAGVMTGSLSLVPVAATPIEAPSVVHRVTRSELAY